MPVTVGLHDHQLNVPTSDEDINELLVEVRDKIGGNWQVVEYVHKKRGFFGRINQHLWYGLYLEVGGFLPYQRIMAVSTARECRCYLLGLLSGWENNKK